ncbi:MAG: protease modulator HflC [Verrucomicrobiota bacterium]|jgi:membrane protease subunit HflC
MKRNLLTVIVGAVLVLIFVLLLFVFQVRQSEVAVVTTFGKPVENIDKPGAYFKWPWPIQKVYKFDQRIQNFEDKFSETLTADNNNLIVTVYTGWRISDASKFYPKFLGSIPQAQSALENMVRNAKNSVFGSNYLSSLVNTDPKQLKFNEIEHQIQATVQADLSTNDYGISLEFLGLKKIELPEGVTASVFQRMIADRQLLINKEQYEGEKEATIIRADADRQAAETIANAEASAIRIHGEAEAAAAPTLRVFEQNPDLYIFLLRIDALKQSLNQKTTLIFDDRTPPFDLFQHLPTNSMSLSQ